MRSKLDTSQKTNSKSSPKPKKDKKGKRRSDEEQDVDKKPSGILRKPSETFIVKEFEEDDTIPISISQLTKKNPHIFLKYLTEQDKTSMSSSENATTLTTSSDGSKIEADENSSTSKTSASSKTSKSSLSEVDEVPRKQFSKKLKSKAPPPPALKSPKQKHLGIDMNQYKHQPWCSEGRYTGEQSEDSGDDE